MKVGYWPRTKINAKIKRQTKVFKWATRIFWVLPKLLIAKHLMPLKEITRAIIKTFFVIYLIQCRKNIVKSRQGIHRSCWNFKTKIMANSKWRKKKIRRCKKKWSSPEAIITISTLRSTSKMKIFYQAASKHAAIKAKHG